MSTDIVTVASLHKLAVVMARTGLSRSAVYRVINEGKIKTVKIGRSVRVSEQELNRFINALAE